MAVPPADRPPPQDRRETIQAWLAEPVQADLTEAVAAATAARHAFLKELGSRIQAPLNDHLRRQPQETYEQKKALASWLNRTLRALDLAVECPSTKMPAIVVANLSENPAKGRFQLNVSLPHGRRTKTKSMARLVDLSLTARDVGLDKNTLWRDRVGRGSGDLFERR